MIIFNADNGAETVHVDWMRQDYGHDASGGWRGMKDNQVCRRFDWLYNRTRKFLQIG